MPRGRDFSSNFPGLTLEGSQDERDHINFSHGVSAYLDEGHNSEHIADRNMSPSTSEAPTVRLVSQKRQLSKSQSQPLRPLVDQHAGSVADWNMIRNEIPAGASWDEASKPLKVKKRNSNLKAASVESIPGSHMGVIEEAPAARDPSWSTTPLDMEGSHEASPFRHEDSRIRDPSWTITPLALEGYQDRSPFESEPSTPALDPGRASLDKPLPPTPSTVAPRTPTSAQTNDKPFSHSKQDSATPMDLDGAVVYRHPDTTSLHEEQAPAVKHEKVIENDDEVRQKVITREVHDYDIYHRILPIKDIEVKPARHFMQVQDGYVEIDEE